MSKREEEIREIFLKYKGEILALVESKEKDTSKSDESPPLPKSKPPLPKSKPPKKEEEKEEEDPKLVRYEDTKVYDLKKEAAEKGIVGRSKMNKEELFNLLGYKRK